MVVAELVARFVARYPAVQVEVHATNSIVDLVAAASISAYASRPSAAYATRRSSPARRHAAHSIGSLAQLSRAARRTA